MSKQIDSSGIDYECPVRFKGAVDLSAASITYPTSRPAVIRAESAFTLADIQAGTFAFTLPAFVTVVSTHIVMTTALTFSAGTTTGATAKVGAGSGFSSASQLSGATGIKTLTKGTLHGQPVAGGVQAITFVATGGTPVLAEVSAGAGTLVLYYLDIS